MEGIEFTREHIYKTIQEYFLENEAGITDSFEFYKRIEQAYIISMHNGTAWVHDSGQVVVPFTQGR
ncbi:MAG TPA: hypothetical protein G4O15_08095 [Dehalococcoidia bacterium]|nr:hypothetical protein [Dehalococcoidia bacterium]